MKRHSLKLFTRFLMSALIIIGIFVLSYGYAYVRTRRTLKRSALEQTLQYVTSNAQAVNDEARKSINWIRQLKENDTVIALNAVRELSPKDYATLRALRKELRTASSGTKDYARMYLLFDRDEKSFVCATETIYHSLPLAQQAGEMGLTGGGAEEFLSMIRGEASTYYLPRLSKACEAYSEGRKNQYVFYAQPLALGGQGRVYGVMQIDVQALFKMLLGKSGLGSGVALTGWSGALYGDAPMDETAQTITYDASREATLLRVPISNLGLTVWFQVTDAEAWQQIQQFTILWRALLGVFLLLVAVAVALAAAYLIYPLQRLISRLSGRGGIHGIEAYLVQMDDRLSEMKPILRATLINKLLRQDYLTPAERAALRALPGFDGEGAWRVAVIGDTSEERYAARSHNERICRMIEEKLPGAQVHPLAQTLFAALLPEYLAEDEPLRIRLTELLGALSEYTGGARFVAGVGLCRGDLLATRASYQEAERAFRDVSVWKDRNICFYEETNDGQEAFWIRYEQLEHMYRMLDSGAAQEASVLFDRIVEQGFQRGKASQTVYLQFLSDIRGVFLRLSGKYDLSPLLRSLMQYDETFSFTYTLALFRHTFSYIGALSESENRHSNDTLAESMRLYLAEKYTDANLSLTSMAERFAMSESALSRLFKNSVGENFSTYLENLRLNEAKVLLLNTCMPIKEIAEMVGYANNTTFYKAFRRRWGVSPSAFRGEKAED